MTRKMLALAPELALPLKAVTEKLGFLGRTGSGKSYAAMKLAEEMYAAQAQFIALDPVGIWWGLRLAGDGKSRGLDIPVFGGLQGDVPLEPTAGRLIADVIVDRGLSAVIDVSQFESDADKARFATDFGARLFHRKKAAPSALHVFIEESQEFIPQNQQRGEERMLHVFTRMWKLGRNYGIGGSIISQRPQEVNKKVINLSELLLVFQLTGPQERKAIAGWIEEKGLDQDLANDLPKLKVGRPHAWSPAWLEISEVVAIGKRWTFDASSTPTVGARAKVRELAPMELANLGEAIAASKERAKAEDPKLLQATVRELQAQLKTGAATPELKKKLTEAEARVRQLEKELLAAVKAAERDQQSVDALVQRHIASTVKEIKRKNGELARSLRGAVEQLQKRLGAVQREIGTADEVLKVLSALKVDEDPQLAPLALGASPTAAPKETAAAFRRGETTVQQPARVERQVFQPPAIVGDVQLSRPQQSMLDTLRQFEELGVEQLDRGALAALTRQSPTSSGYDNNCGKLRTAGLVSYPQGGAIALTDAGRELAAEPQSTPTLADYHERWSEILSGPQWRMCEALLADGEMSRAELAERTGQSPSSSGFDNNLGKLRNTFGLIDYPASGRVAATDRLSPDGLR